MTANRALELCGEWRALATRIKADNEHDCGRRAESRVALLRMCAAQLELAVLTDGRNNGQLAEVKT